MIEHKAVHRSRKQKEEGKERGDGWMLCVYVCMHVYSTLKEKLKRLKKLSNRDRERAGGLRCLFGCNGKTAGGGPALDRAWMGIIY